MNTMSHLCRGPSALARVAVFLTVATLAPRVLSQGCIPARHISLSLGAEGLEYLERGEWEVNVAYRYLHSERIFIAAQEQPQLHDAGPRNTFHSLDLTATYAFHRRFDLSLTLPFVHDDASSIDNDGVRRTVSSGGLGDIRLVADIWLLDPAKHKDGNITVGVGMKFPTGDANAKGPNHNPDGSVSQETLIVTQQTGDGGWGAVFQMQAFQKLVDKLYGYAAGFYLLNPQKKNEFNSIPDIYSARLGFSYDFWAKLGLSFSLGARIDGVPVKDIIGGGDDGFRRAGYAIYVDPQLSWTRGKNSFSVGVPVAVERYEERTVSDRALSAAAGRRIGGRGGFADYMVTASYSRRF